MAGPRNEQQQRKQRCDKKERQKRGVLSRRGWHEETLGSSRDGRGGCRESHRLSLRDREQTDSVRLGNQIDLISLPERRGRPGCRNLHMQQAILDISSDEKDLK